jgi:hypothetical protein
VLEAVCFFCSRIKTDEVASHRILFHSFRIPFGFPNQRPYGTRVRD